MDDVLKIQNPWNGALADEIALDGPDAIDGKVRAAKAAAASWREVALSDRLALAARFVDEALADEQAIAALVTRQMGKPIQEARGEVRGMVGRARTMIELAPAALRDLEIVRDDGIGRTIVRDPLGVVLDIAAWNYPLLIAVNVVVPAVISGNTVVLKHASQTAGVGPWFQEMFRRAGAPAGVVASVSVRGRDARSLVQHPSVDGVFFTGSVDAGRTVHAAVATREAGFLDTGLELGGKDPAYVRGDIPLDVVVPNLVEGAFYNAGQSCCAVERIYVTRDRYKDFVEAYVAQARAWTVSDPTQDRCVLGAVASPETLDVLSRQVRDATARGGRVLLGGQRLDGPGWRFPATVVADANHEMALMREESFGPIIGIMPVEGDEEAVVRMNDTPFGLTASIWTADHVSGAALGRRVRAGTVFVNRCDYVDPTLPWTGLGDSGKGISLSALGYAHLTRARGLHVRTLEMLG